ncbi:cell division protein [Bacteroidia bacterium]|nr:cell division protein [Bacteroidia bacterium]
MNRQIYLLGLVATTLWVFSSCKPQQSAYQQVYRTAKAKPVEFPTSDDSDNEPSLVRPVAPRTSRTVSETGSGGLVTTSTTGMLADFTTEEPSTGASAFRREQLTSADGGTIQRYSVIIGSFINQTNAKSLKERMQFEGYRPVIAQNKTGMYRVIIATFDTRAAALAERDRIKSKFEPDFDDAWLLESE